MNLKLSLIIALSVSLIATISWEIYWRSQGVEPNIDDTKNLWANQRAKLENPKENTVVFIGSSRILYDIQLDIWIEETQTDPVMLAAQGSSPIPVLKDIVENTDFNGTIMAGITNFLLFSTIYPEADFMKRPQSLIDYYYDRTYAQRIGDALSIPLQRNLAFYRDGLEEWDSDVDLKSLLQKFKDERSGPRYPVWNNFEDITVERHMKMPARMENDTAYANTVKNVWKFLLSGEAPPPDKDGTINTFVDLAKKFIDRGGNLILLRCPSDGVFLGMDQFGFPREEYWDVLVEKSGAKGYNYLDYEQLQGLFLPEWSHLATKDAQFFTKEIIKIMKSDGVLPNQKSN